MLDRISRRRRLALVALAVLSLIAGAAWLLRAGALRVPAGRMALVGRGDGVRVVETGWGWRRPGAPVVLLPTSPQPLALTVELPLTPTPLKVRVSANASVAAIHGARWFAAAGMLPLEEGLARLLRAELPAALGELEPTDWFAPATEQQLAEAVKAAARRAGVALDGLAARVPRGENPGPLAAARGALRSRLARGEAGRVLVVGWDGADWSMIRPLLDAGRMPNLGRLMGRGIHGDLRSATPLLSPLLWTTIATGKAPAEHGILEFLAKDAAGNLVPVSSQSRKVPALWTLLSSVGMRSQVIGWWATWPAEPIEGLMVSDRVAYQLFDYAGSGSRTGKVHPDERWSEVERHLVPAEAISYRDVRRFLAITEEELERFWRETPEAERMHQPVNHFRRILATTRAYHSLALAALREPAELTLVYYEGSDTTGHLFARYLPPRLPVVSEADARRYGAALPEFYVYLDELLGELVAAAGEATDVLVVSDHGFHTGAARPEADPADFTTGAVKWHRLHGILVAAGPRFGRGPVTGATIFDVAPTVLALVGLPVAADMPGRSLARRPAEPPVALASYSQVPVLVPEVVLAEAAGADTAARAAEDEARMRELAALGYIGGAPKASGAPPRAAAPAAPPAGGAPTAPAVPRGADLTGAATEAYNLAAIHHNRGEYERAIELYHVALSRLPSMGTAWANLANVYALQGRHAEAFATLVEGYGKSGDIPRANLITLVREAEAAGRLGAAGGVLRQLEPRYGATASFHAALGLFEKGSGREAEAQRGFERALEIDPLDSLALGEVLAHQRRSGRESEGRQRFAVAVAAARGSLDATNELAVVALQQEWPDQAEPLLRAVLESDPGNPGVLANLAVAQLRQGRVSEAIATMQSSLERDPTNGRNFFNLGAMLAGQGRNEEALAAFRQAIANGVRTARAFVAVSKIEFRLGQPERAKAALREALALEPGDAEARELLQLLETG